MRPSPLVVKMSVRGEPKLSDGGRIFTMAVMPKGHSVGQENRQCPLWVESGHSDGYPRVMIQPRLTSDDLEHIVIDCVVRASGVDASRVVADTDVVFGLGMAGDDGVDLISDLRSATGTHLSEHDFYRHFGPESAFSMHSGEPLTVAQLVKLVEAELDGH